MKVKEILGVIIDKGKVEDMYKLNEMLNNLVCDLKEQKPKLYKEYKRELYEIAYGNVILKDKAEEIVSNMKPFGEHYTLEEANEIKETYSLKHTNTDIYLVINSLYNDYQELFDSNDEMYAKLTKLWLNDEDSVEDKVYEYFMNIVKE